VPETNTTSTPQWIAERAGVEAYAARALPRETLALDTEFIRTQTFHAELGLVQLASADEIALIDPLVPELTPALAALLAAPGLIKIVHSASEDLEVIAHALGVVPAPLFDTQIAAVLCGYEQPPSYQKLVAQELGLTLDKHATRTDWLKRPLDAEQLRYAAEDVLHLDALYQGLDERLESLGRRGWMAEECLRALEKSKQPLDPHPHLKIRGAERMTPPQQQRLWRLLHWRDREALARNRPKKWILDNPVAVRAALLEHPELKALEAAVAADGKPSTRLAQKLETLLKSPASAAEASVPLLLAQTEPEKQRTKELRERAIAAAKTLALNPDFLLPRRGLEYWARHQVLPEDLRGWREQVLELA
jgi:ribonuclease D